MEDAHTSQARKPGREIKNMYYIHHMSIPLALTLILSIMLGRSPTSALRLFFLRLTNNRSQAQA